MAISKNQISLYQVSEINLSYQPKFKASERPQITSSKDAYDVLYNNWDLDKIQMLEQFKIILLNRTNKVIGIFQVSSGGIAGTVADPKLIFAVALKACASSIVLSHNHPSGNLKPSSQDIELTKKITTAGNYLDIRVLDHVIITNDNYYSFADEGMI